MADIFGCNNIPIIRRRNARTINSCAESSRNNAVNPGVNVGLLFGQHASALLLIKKDDGPARKAFLTRGCSGSPRIGPADQLCIAYRFQFGVQAAIEQHKKSETS